MKSFKVSLIALALAGVSNFASAGAITAGAAAAHDVSTTDCTFIKKAIKVNVSANVALNYACSTAVAAVTTANTKGRYSYAGTTMGGSVKPCTVSSGSNAPEPTAPDLTNDTGGACTAGL